MNVELEYLAGYYIAAVEIPTPGEIAKDIWGVSWYPDIDAWCEQTFGAQDIWGNDPVTGWKRMQHKYFFTDDSKRAWFLLRWS